MLTWEGQDQVDVIVGNELVNGIHEIEQADKIKIRTVRCQAGFQFGPFRLIFFGDLDIMVLIHIDDMQPGFEEVEDRLDGMDGNGILGILEIGEQQDVFGGSGYRVRRHDDNRNDASFDDIEGIAAHQHFPETGGTGSAHDNEPDVIIQDIGFQAIQEAIALLRDDADLDAGNGGQLRAHAFQCNVDDSLSAFIFCFVGAQGTAVRPVFEGLENIIQDEVGI